ncbi:MAG: nucleotidyl transferase AbiEii/AbiGii toxin family protein [Bacteroidia bacterium]
MTTKLYLSTISAQLNDALELLMQAPEFDMFRLVGGTALSLQRGHRMSVDIDLFTDAEYGSIDFKKLDLFLKSNFEIHDTGKDILPAIGKSYIAGKSENDLVKIDIYYTDPFIFPAVTVNKIRLASIEKIIAMKMDVIQRTGRKKDFWDLHELSNDYTFEQMLELHQLRYPYTHNRQEIIAKMADFDAADYDFEPVCLRGQHWELIKMNLADFISGVAI